MTHKVHKLDEAEEGKQTHMNGVRGPTWWSVLRVEQEVHAAQAKKHPVVSAILEDVQEWHCVVRKPMDEQGFELPFGIVAYHHCES